MFKLPQKNCLLTIRGQGENMEHCLKVGKYHHVKCKNCTNDYITNYFVYLMIKLDNDFVT